MHDSLRRSPLAIFTLTLVATACGPQASPSAPSPAASSSAAPPAPPAPSASASAPPAKAPPRADPSVLPRKVLFGNPDVAGVKTSPDGKHLSWLSADGGLLNVFVAPAGDPKAARVVTKDRTRGIRTYYWTYQPDLLVYLQDKGGDENFHAFVVNVKTGEERDLAPLEGVRVEIEALSYRRPGEIVLGLNDRDKRHHDLYRVDLKTGKRTLLQLNEEGFSGFELDLEHRVRLATRVNADATKEVLVPEKKGFKQLFKLDAEDAFSTGVIGLDRSGQSAYLLDPRGRDKAAVVKVDLRSGKGSLLGEATDADVTDVRFHPTERTPQWYTSYRERVLHHPIDRAVADDLAELRKLSAGDLDVVSRTLDDRIWIVCFETSNGPLRYYRYDRKSKKAEFLFVNRKALEGAPLSTMHPVEIKARDGLGLVSYLTLPRDSDPEQDGKPNSKAPLVLAVHGGPWARDEWGFNSSHQWFASRGYAVLSVNYRGSRGFGKKFLNAANHEWAAKMHDDLIDAVKWAVDAGVTDRDKVAIWGGSYGGYSALVGLTFTPEVFACAVDIVGPSNLVTLLENAPPYWQPMMPMLKQRIGDVGTEEGRKYLLARSPLSFVDRISRPLLIGQGANDPRVKKLESDQVVKAMKERGIPVTYVLYPDEGHGFARPQNRMSFMAVTEVFLASCLGGVYQPYGSDFDGASLTVPEGAEHVHGLAAALAR